MVTFLEFGCFFSYRYIHIFFYVFRDFIVMQYFTVNSMAVYNASLFTQNKGTKAVTGAEPFQKVLYTVSTNMFL